MGTLETFTPAVRANRVCTARRAKRNNTALMAPKKPSSTQNATLQSMGMDVIKQYPGPLTVSRKKTDNPREGWEDGIPPPHTSKII